MSTAVDTPTSPSDHPADPVAGGAAPAARPRGPAARLPRSSRPCCWLFPIGWALLTASLRLRRTPPTHGYLSLGGCTFDNYADAWERAEFTQHFLNTSDHHGARRAADPVPALVRGVRARPVQLAVQLRLLGALHRRQPAAPAGPAHPAVPAVTARSRCRPFMSDSGTLLRQLLGPDPDPRRLPDRLLRVRAEQLHEDAAAAS